MSLKRRLERLEQLTPPDRPGKPADNPDLDRALSRLDEHERRVYFAALSDARRQEDLSQHLLGIPARLHCIVEESGDHAQDVARLKRVIAAGGMSQEAKDASFMLLTLYLAAERGIISL